MGWKVCLGFPELPSSWGTKRNRTSRTWGASSIREVVGFEAGEGSSCRLIAEEQGAKRGHPPNSRALVMGHWGRFKGKFEVMVKAEATETDLGRPEKHP